MPRRRIPLNHKQNLRIGHPTGAIFLDESGSIARDRFFAVGSLKLAQPSILLRRVEKLRDERHWYREIHFADLTKGALPFYKEVVDVLAAAELEFFCFVADREAADPVARFGSHHKAYEKLATQLLVAGIKPYEVVSVMADNYSTPDHVRFEEDVRTEVNRRLRRMAVMTVCRLDSSAAVPLQLVDLLVSAVTFEYRQNAGFASLTSAKGQLASYVREAFDIDSFLQGTTSPLKVKVYAEEPSAVKA
jgi:hypothetical protein